MSLTPRIENKDNSSLEKIEVPEINNLFNILKNIESKPNIFTLAEFKEFEPIFRKYDEISDEDLKELTKKFKRAVDFYKEIVIVKSKSDRTIVVTLPPIFVPVRSLSSTETNRILVDINSKLGMSGIPKYSSEAFGRMATSLLIEQNFNKNVVMEYREKYKEIMNNFLTIYNKTPQTEQHEQEVISDESSVLKQTSWGFED